MPKKRSHRGPAPHGNGGLATSTTPRGGRRHRDEAPREEITVAIWLSSENASAAVEDAVVAVLATAGFEWADADQPVIGSWFRRIRFKVRRTLTSEEARQRLREVEHAIELQVVTKTQAEIDSKQAEAVSNLLNALQDTPDAVIQLGSILLVKVDGVPAVRTLTLQEITYLKRNPNLVKNPRTILTRLQRSDVENEHRRRYPYDAKNPFERDQKTAPPVIGL